MRVLNRRFDRRFGERHFRVRLSDFDVGLMRALHEEHHLGYKQLSGKFNAPVSTVRDICRYHTRAFDGR
jgi:hypothetical protein